MFQLKPSNLNKTPVERNYYDIIKKDIGGLGLPCTGVTCDYRYRLRLINNYLIDVYGKELADWNVSVGNHLSLMNTDSTYCPAATIHDIQLVPEETISQIINYDDLTDRLAEEAKECVEKWKKQQDLPALLNACDIFGIYPRLKEDPTKPQLNHFLVNWPVSQDKLIEVQKYTLSDPQKVILLGMTADMLATAYNDQYYATFPFVGTLVMQPKRISYYRGENAYYGTSRPSFYRSPDVRSLPPVVQQAVRTMKYDECGIRILDKLQAAVDWTRQISDCNYLALMQHHGLPTEMIDITSDFRVALFFACCKWVGEGRFGHWEPLRKGDFEHADSRPNIAKLGGDSRFGIIYRTSSEFEDLAWANIDPLKVDGEGKDKISKGEREYLEICNYIVPVGYQAFNRSGLQSAYMLMTGDPDYDMLKDPRFCKLRFRLNENLCEWIYQYMDKGARIYPHEDVPDISKYIEKMAANPTVFSKSTFEKYVKKAGLSKPQADELEEGLLNYGFVISDHEIDYFDESELDEINRDYTIDKVLGKYKINCVGRPFVVIGVQRDGSF